MSELLDALIANNDSICRALADSTADFVCLATSHGEPFYLNLAARRMVGMGDDEPIVSESLHDFYADDSWKELRDVGVPAVNRTGHWEGRSQIRNRRTAILRRCRRSCSASSRRRARCPLVWRSSIATPGRGTASARPSKSRRPASTRSSNPRWTRSLRSTTKE